MIPIKKIIITMVIAASLLACSTSENNMIPEELWENLDPLSRNFQEGLDLLPKFMDDEGNRIKAIEFVNNKLNSSRLSFTDQIRLGGLVRGMQEKAQPNEYGVVCQLISKGKEFPHYYNLALSPKPPYLLESIKVFKDSDEMYAKFYGHDGSIHEFNIKDNFIRHLFIVTGKNFGRSYQDWMNWWKKEGQYLEFDYDSNKYKKR